MEEVLDQAGRGDDGDEGDAAGEDPAEQGGALDEWPATDALRAPVRQRPAHFLLDRLEEPRRNDEDERPEAVQRGVAGVGEPAGGEDLEAVRREPDDDESTTDGVGAFGERSVLGGLDEPLLTLCHCPAVLDWWSLEILRLALPQP